MEKVNHVGKYYGKLYVLKQSKVKTHYFVTVLCECGKIQTVRFSDLKKKTKHLSSGTECGCVRHGMSRSKTYSVWSGIIQRCLKKNGANYYKYGARGIKVCDRWLDFKNFYADMGEMPQGMSIDRIDNSGDYCPENCRWADSKTQSRNKRNNRIITLNGVSKCCASWADDYEISSHLISQRLSRGWSDERAVTTPAREYARNK